MGKPRAGSARLETAAAATLILLALALRLNHLGWSLPHSYEEAMPLRIAWKMWGWDDGVDVDLNPGFFNYPSLTFYIQFLAQGALYGAMKLFGAIESLTDWRVAYVIDPTPIFLAARAVSVIFAVATAWIVYRTGRLVAGAGAGLLALALLAVNPFHVARSQMVEVDVPLTFLAALALYGAVRISLEGRRRDYVLAGVAAGLAASSKYTGALLLVPIALAHLLFARAPRRPAHSRRPQFRNLALAGALALVCFVATSPYVLLDFEQFRKDFNVEQEHMAFGHFGMEGGATWMFYASALAGDVMSLPALIAALLGIGLALRRGSGPAIVLTSFLILYLAVVSTWAMKAERYLLPALPPLLVFTGVGLVGISRRVHERVPRARFGAVAAILSAVVLAFDVAGYARHVDSYQEDTRTNVAEWLLANAAPGSYIVTEPYGPNLIPPSYIMTLNHEMRKAIIERIQGQPMFAVQTMPMFQVYPERSARFYTLDLYPNADYFIVSSGVASRYRRDRNRFAQQNAFYDALERQLVKVAEFVPARPGGVRLTLYQRPSARSFAGRQAALPPRLAPAGMNPIDARFYFEMGTNYELFKRLDEASLSYQYGIEQGMEDPHLFQNCVLGKARCVLAQRGGEDAVAFVRSVSEIVTDAAMRATLTDIANQMADALRRQAQKR